MSRSNEIADAVVRTLDQYFATSTAKAGGDL